MIYPLTMLVRFSDMLSYLFFLLFFISIVLSYIGGRVLDPQFMVAICAYLVVAGLVDCDGIITELTHYYV